MAISVHYCDSHDAVLAEYALETVSRGGKKDSFIEGFPLQSRHARHRSRIAGEFQI